MITLKSLRQFKKLTLEQIAELIGVTRQTYSRIEKWEVELSLGQAVRLSEFFGISLDSLYSKNNSRILGADNFDWEKYKQIIKNFIFYWGREDGKIPKTKLAKLCYLLDFSWYYYNLTPITGLEYRKIQQGPVPDIYFTTLEELEEEKSIAIKPKGSAYMISNIDAPQNDKLSSEELSLLQKIAEKRKTKRTQQIVDFTHQQLPRSIANEKEIIPYSLITQEDDNNIY